MIGLLGALLLGGCVAEEPVLSEEQLELAVTLSPVPEPPPDPTNAVADDPAAAELGALLFEDTRLSADGTVACSTCHDPDQGFADGLVLGEGLDTVGRHTPTLLGAAWNRWQFWDGRADSLWAQALGPLEAPLEHGSTRTSVALLMAEDADYAARYTELFGELPPLEGLPERAAPLADAEDPASQAWDQLDAQTQDEINRVFSNVGKAIAAFERTIHPGEAPFDRYIAAVQSGDPTGGGELSPAAERGLGIFVGVGQCTLCHFGPMLSNSEFHNIGLGDREWLDADVGRYDGAEAVLSDPFNGMGAYSDAPDAPEVVDKLAYLNPDAEAVLGAFKTPTLRNVALTAPYMHGGHFETLHEVLDYYSELDEEPLYGHREESLVPLELSPGEIDDLVAFLESLSGDSAGADQK